MKHKKSGFTLVEIIVSLALICIIAVGIIPAFAAQLKMTIDTKNITTQAFDAQGEVERLIQELKATLDEDTIDISSYSGVTTESIRIFNRDVTMYKLIQEFPGNANMDFTVFLSQKLAKMEVRQLLVATGVTIEVSNETVHKVADLKKTPKPTLIGKFATNVDTNWYANLYKWYVSKEGDPDPVFPDDYERIVFAGATPSTLTDLTKLANKYIVFTVTPVDIHGVRGNEARSDNTIYVLGEEWRAGVFAWVDKDADISFESDTDVKVEKSLTWPLIKDFNSSNDFMDPSNPDNWLDPSEGSLYVPMGIGKAAGDIVGPIEITGANVLDWVVDKSINLATDITVSNSSDIYMKAMDGNIVLYQYIQLDPSTGDAVFKSDGMPSMINDGPELKAPYGEVLFETGGRGDVTLQNYTVLDAGSDISLTPFGHVSIYQASLKAGGSILLDSTGGSTYPGDRDIIIQDSLLSLESSYVPNRSITVKTLDELEISDTIFSGNAGMLSKVNLTATDGITMDDTSFVKSEIKVNSGIAMTGGGWDENSTLTVAEGKGIVFGASGTKIANSGSLVLGDTGAVSFVSNMLDDLSNPLAINLGKGGNTDEVDITTTYGRNVGYADSSSAEYIGEYGTFQDLGSGSTNLEYTVAKTSGYGSPVLTYEFDGDNTITINASGIATGPISAYYTLSVGDQYAEDVVGTIVFKVKADEGESPVVTVIGSTIPTFTVTFDKNGGTADANPATMAVRDGESAGSLPEPPTYPGHNFTSWNMAANGTGSEFNAATIVTDNITVYAQYTLIPVYTVTFNRNGGTTEASPSTMPVEYGSPIGTLPTAPTRTGYWFQNWSTLQTGGSLITAETQVYADMTAYAQWTLKKTFADINNGEYISISNVRFQKISPTQLLARNRITYGSDNTMIWNTAYTQATAYYTGFNSSNSWVLSSGLVDGTLLGSLNAYRTSILRDSSYEWWGGSWSNTLAYLIGTNGRLSNNANKYNYYSCRPYVAVNSTNLYVSSGSGTSADPYILTNN